MDEVIMERNNRPRRVLPGLLGTEGDGRVFTFHVSRFTSSRHAFTLIEVMIACGIFFMCTFAILALVANTLRNARGLQRGEVDAGMAASQIFELLKTNKQPDLSGSGDFGDAYPDFSYAFQCGEYQTNGLLQVDIVVNRRGARQPADQLRIWVYNPDAKFR